MSAARTPPGIALIGCGAIATAVHLRVLRDLPDVRLVAAADPHTAARERVQALAGIPVVADAGDLLVRPDVDAVVICARSDRHAQLVAEAVDQGKHVYVEKPLATSAEGAATVSAAVSRSGVVVAVGFNRRRHPAVVEARRLIATGTIGAVQAVQSAFCERGEMPEWKRHRATGGGALLDLGSHHLDLIPWLVGRPITSVSATLTSGLSEHDSAFLELELGGECRAQCLFSFRGARADYLEIIGERGVLRLDRYGPPLAVWLPRRGPGVRRSLRIPSADLLRWRLRRLARPADPSFALSLRAFAARLNGGAEDLPGVEDGLAALATVLAAEQSAAGHRRVTVGMTA